MAGPWRTDVMPEPRAVGAHPFSEVGAEMGQESLLDSHVGMEKLGADT